VMQIDTGHWPIALSSIFSPFGGGAAAEPHSGALNPESFAGLAGMTSLGATVDIIHPAPGICSALVARNSALIAHPARKILRYFPGPIPGGIARVAVASVVGGAPNIVSSSRR